MLDCNRRTSQRHIVETHRNVDRSSHNLQHEHQIDKSLSMQSGTSQNLGVMNDPGQVATHIMSPPDTVRTLCAADSPLVSRLLHEELETSGRRALSFFFLLRLKLRFFSSHESYPWHAANILGQ